MKMLVAGLLLLADPARAQSQSGTTPSGIFYQVSGTGAPVVLAHAFSVDRRMWDAQIDALETSFRIVRYDLRGHGRSAAPSGPYSGYDDLREVLDTLKVDRAAIVGLSAGSEIAVNFALKYPDRVARLVLASPGLGGYMVPPIPWANPVFEAAARGDAQGAARLWAETPIMMVRKNEQARVTGCLVIVGYSRQRRLFRLRRLRSSARSSGWEMLTPPVRSADPSSRGTTIAAVGVTSSSAAPWLASHVPNDTATSYTRPGTRWPRLTPSMIPSVCLRIRIRTVAGAYQH